MFEFNTQLTIGDQGEKYIQDVYPTKLVKSTDYAYDFVCQETGRKVEIKTDSYSMTKTPNFFIERYSDIARKESKPGGPWRAAQDNVDTFIYLFIKEGIYFQFDDLPALIKRLDYITKHSEMTHVRNTSWVTGGYRVRRNSLRDFYTIHKGPI